MQIIYFFYNQTNQILFIETDTYAMQAKNPQNRNQNNFIETDTHAMQAKKPQNRSK